MVAALQDVTGFRGEKIVELCLTDYSAFSRALFRPAFLGDKWPSIDFYVELMALPRKTPYFFIQAKTTSSTLRPASRALRVSTRASDIEHLLRIPGPTYLFGVHELSHRVFVRSVHSGVPLKAITRISLSNELTSEKLRLLYDEVKAFWKGVDHKPKSSVFL